MTVVSALDDEATTGCLATRVAGNMPPRTRQIAAALYLSRVNDSNLRAVQALSLQGPIAVSVDGQ
jgi:hypothetical protein